MTKPKIVAIIPARGGSKRIPGKNIKMLNGVPVLAYTIRAAQNSKYVDRVIVSTDSDDIKAVALKWGAEVPFRRPADISEDVPTEDVTIHAVKWLKENDGYNPEIVVTLEPTAPFRTATHIDTCVERLLNNKELDSCITVHRIKGGRPEWYVRLKDEKITPYTDHFLKQGKAILKFPASQIFEPLHVIDGVVFCSRTSTLFDYNSLVGENVGALEVGHDVCVDLNWPEDFAEAEAAMKKLNYKIT